MNEKDLYLSEYDYDIIFGQQYKLVPRPYIEISKLPEQALDRFVSNTNKVLQRANNCKHK